MCSRDPLASMEQLGSASRAAPAAPAAPAWRKRRRLRPMRRRSVAEAHVAPVGGRQLRPPADRLAKTPRFGCRLGEGMRRLTLAVLLAVAALTGASAASAQTEYPLGRLVPPEFLNEPAAIPA